MQPEYHVVVYVDAFVFVYAITVRASSPTTRAAGVPAASFAFPSCGTQPPFRLRRRTVARSSRRPTCVLLRLLVREQEDEQEADHSKCASTKRISGFTFSPYESGISAKSRPAKPTSKAACPVFFPGEQQIAIHRLIITFEP